MSASNLDKMPTRTQDQVRSSIEQADRLRWYRAQHASGDHGIISPRDGREVARCHSETDRDFLLSAARSHDTLKSALDELLEQIECLGGIEFSKDLDPYKAEACWDDAIKRAQAALALARAVKL